MLSARLGYAGPWESSLNVPNLITGARLVVALAVLALIRFGEGLWLLAAGLFVLASVADILDGRLARRLGQVTTVGQVLDPFVDKVAICGALILLSGKHAVYADPTLGTATGGFTLDSGVTVWMVLAVVLRELYVSSLRTLMAERRHDVSADALGKTKMVLQCCAVTASLLSLSPAVARGFPLFIPFRDTLLWVTVAVTVVSGVSYTLAARRAVSASASAPAE
jgi:CDP-diacylglycerol---glycerol-3-phosphate 3-phosphatidyltransferase